MILNSLVPRFKPRTQAWKALVISTEGSRVDLDAHPVIVEEVIIDKMLKRISYIYRDPQHEQPLRSNGAELLATRREAERRIMSHLLGVQHKWFTPGMKAWLLARSTISAITLCPQCVIPNPACTLCKGQGTCLGETLYTAVQEVEIRQFELISDDRMKIVYTAGCRELIAASADHLYYTQVEAEQAQQDSTITNRYAPTLINKPERNED